MFNIFDSIFTGLEDSCNANKDILKIINSYVNTMGAGVNKECLDWYDVFVKNAKEIRLYDTHAKKVPIYRGVCDFLVPETHDTFTVSPCFFYIDLFDTMKDENGDSLFSFTINVVDLNTDRQIIAFSMDFNRGKADVMAISENEKIDRDLNKIRIIVENEFELLGSQMQRFVVSTFVEHILYEYMRSDTLKTYYVNQEFDL